MVLRKTADRSEYNSASESRQLLPCRRGSWAALSGRIAESYRGAFVAFLALSMIATLLIGLARRPLKPSLDL